MPDTHKDHRSRVKKEFLSQGMDHFPDHKVLETLLFFSVPRRDTNELGHLLINRFGSISGVLDASYDMLLETPGIGPESATLLKVVSGLIRRYMDDYAATHNVIKSHQDAKEYMQHKFLCEAKECIYLACLGMNGKVVFCDRVAEGSPERVDIVPATVVKLALRSNAVRAILAHNHPNGMCIPSNKDLIATNILSDELRRVDVELMDHIIVAPDGVYSMVENGMFPASV